MELNSKLIITHDYSNHGIPLGKVVLYKRRKTPHTLVVQYGVNEFFIESTEFVELQYHQFEKVLDHRNRTMKHAKNVLLIINAIVLTLISILFFTSDPIGVTDITAGFVSLVYAVFSVYLLIKTWKFDGLEI